MEQPEAVLESTVEDVVEDVVEEVEVSTEVDVESVEEYEGDEEEVEYEGEKFTLPKKLKDALLRQADYTKKTQEVAEQRKEIEKQREEFRTQSASHEQYIQDIAEVVGLNKQIEQYNAVNWTELIDSDPVQAMKLDRQLRELVAARDAAAGSITQKQQQRALEQQQLTAKQLQEAAAVVASEIPNWGPETQRALTDFGKTMGYKDEELSTIIDPRAVKVLHKAYLYDQMAAKQAKKPKPESQEKPITRLVATKNGGKKAPEDMTDREFAEFRRKQIANRHR